MVETKPQLDILGHHVKPPVSGMGCIMLNGWQKEVF